MTVRWSPCASILAQRVSQQTLVFDVPYPEVIVSRRLRPYTMQYFIFYMIKERIVINLIISSPEAIIHTR